MSSLTFGKLANVQTVGIGLYLALAVIQAVSAGGVTGLRRRATALQHAAEASKLELEYDAIRQLHAEVSRLEISFQAVNKTVLWTSVALFVIANVYFSYCTVLQDEKINIYEACFIFFYYLVLPTIIFAATALLIKSRCKETGDRIKEAERRVRKCAFDLP